MTTKTYTATSAYRTITVEVTEKGTVYATNGALMGDLNGMELLGWEFMA